MVENPPHSPFAKGESEAWGICRANGRSPLPVAAGLLPAFPIELQPSAISLPPSACPQDTLALKIEN